MMRDMLYAIAMADYDQYGVAPSKKLITMRLEGSTKSQIEVFHCYWTYLFGNNPCKITIFGGMDPSHYKGSQMLASKETCVAILIEAEDFGSYFSRDMWSRRFSHIR
ncbi:unnamed protein product [Urochloa humidicola]